MAPSAFSRRLASVTVAIAALTALGACDKPKNRPAPNSELAQQGLPPGAPANAVVTPVSREPLPPQPAWAASYVGKPISEVFPDQNGQCVGNTDAVDLYYRGSAQGVRVEGWGWAPAAKAVIARVVLTDDAGKIVGAGETGKPRPDVTAANKDITSPTTGWQAVTAQTAGAVNAYGLMPDGKQVCRLGRLEL